MRFRSRRLVGRGSLLCGSSRGGRRSCLHRFGSRDIGSKRDWLRVHGGKGRCSLLLRRCRNLFGLRGGLLRLAFITLRIRVLILEKAEDVIEDKVTIGLLGEEKSLNELPPRLATV
jgi:hypothetical protein